MNEKQHRLFVRDKLTWLGYLLIGYYCFVVASFGPLIPFLQAELHLNYTVAAYHFSACALGGIMAGSIGERTMTKLGRSRTIWTGGSGVVLGLLIALFGHSAVCTIFGAWLIGFCGNQMCQTVTSINSDRFKDERAVAITESNIAASIFCASAPLIVSFIIRTGLSWRIALIVPMVMFALLVLFFRNTVRGEVASSPPRAVGGPLPLAFWAYACVILLSVACEWSIIFWSAAFLEKVVHLTQSDAAIGVSIFLSSVFAGRIIGSRLARTFPASTVLPIAASLASIGFLTFWLGTSPVINLLGLVLTGIGEANIYPLSLSSALGVASEQSAKATARMAIASGLAVLSAPLVLAMLADHSGIQSAFGFLAVLLVLATGMVFVANLLTHRHYRAQLAPIKL